MGGSYLAGGRRQRIGLLLVLLAEEEGHGVRLDGERRGGRRCRSSTHSACDGSWGDIARGREAGGWGDVPNSGSREQFRRVYGEGGLRACRSQCRRGAQVQGRCGGWCMVAMRRGSDGVGDLAGQSL